jgi:hypothetical protein
MDAKLNIQDCFRAYYQDKDVRPRIHAELNMLEYIYMNQLPFVDDDCSLPAASQRAIAVITILIFIQKVLYALHHIGLGTWIGVP